MFTSNNCDIRNRHEKANIPLKRNKAHEDKELGTYFENDISVIFGNAKWHSFCCVDYSQITYVIDITTEGW